ncbi:hypothetical protein ACIRYZ_14445 [Kitasatospora sp. NPDC101155]|uniref:hypothetical protein n=1 Tax=Kitasatospora sp. NPDC101155 TaxID=3364097 RepID=UPI00380934DE
MLPASVAYRKSGRRIRAELIRKGLPASVVALPPGLVANHALPVHLWELRRPAEGAAAPTRIRMVDLGAATPESIVAGAEEAAAGQVAEVPLIDVLDEDVDQPRALGGRRPRRLPGRVRRPA